MHADNPLVLRTSLCLPSLSALPMIVDNDGMGVWFLSYVNSLGTYLLRYSKVKSAHSLSLDLFWLLDFSTSWLILVSDSDSYYTVCLLLTSVVFLTQSSTTLTRLFDVRSVYTWFTIYRTNPVYSTHFYQLDSPIIDLLSRCLLYSLCLLDLLILFCLSNRLSFFLTCSWFVIIHLLDSLVVLSAWLACLLDSVHLWLALSMTHSVYWTLYLCDSSCQLDLFCLTCLSTQLAHLSQLSVHPPLSPSSWLACLLSVYLTHLPWLVLLPNSLRLLDVLVFWTTSSITLTGPLDLLWLSDYLVYLTHLVCLTL
jgi:hypothetical protein